MGQQAEADGKKIVHATICGNCDDHAWCTKHKQVKYEHFTSLLKAEVAKELPDWYLSINAVEKIQIGSFEVYYDGKTFFSKCERQIWPHIATVVKRIKEYDSEKEKGE